MSALVPRERIEKTILVIRGHRVMLDTDLAKLYGVTTFNLNKAVKRNIDRFPEDFMFRLSAQEAAALTFQIGISKPRGRGGRRNAHYVLANMAQYRSAWLRIGILECIGYDCQKNGPH